VDQLPEERGLNAWVQRHINAPHAYWLFFALFSLEALLIIPLDPLLAFFVMNRRDNAFRLAAIATLGPFVSALVGYAIGDFLWDVIGHKIVLLLVKQATFDAFVIGYKQQYIPTLFVGSLLPMPFKVLVISAGFCQLPVVPYCAAIVSARLIRFFGIAYVGQRWGEAVIQFIRQYSRHILLILAIKIVIAVVCYSVFFR
jgi:membrane protein YqaA with SNARE-associated domain